MTENEWLDHVTHKAAEAIGQWLERRGNLHRPINSLTMPELEGMAAAAISRYANLRTERQREEPDTKADPIPHLLA